MDVHGTTVKRLWERALTKTSMAVSVNRVAPAVLGFLAIVLLAAPVYVTATTDYADIVMYIDAGWRIQHGQTPHVDFFSPFGPLSAYLYTLVSCVFSAAQPVLAAQYGVLLIAIPLMMAATSEAPPRAAVLLWLCFGLFALLPANFLTYPEPFNAAGVDGHGVYNRQAATLLYVLVTALWWSTHGVRNAIVAVAVLVALAFIKISAFGAAFGLSAAGLAAGRIQWRMAAVCCLVAAVALVVLEWSTGLISAYVGDIRLFLSASAVTSADNGLARKLVNSLNTNLIAVIMIGACSVCLIGAGGFFGIFKKFSWREVRKLADEPVVKLALTLALGLVIETQNNGSQPFVFVLPAMLWVAMAYDAQGGAWRKAASIAAIMFIGATVALGGVKLVRIAKTALVSERLDIPEVEGFRLSYILDSKERARKWLDATAANPAREAAPFAEDRERLEDKYRIDSAILSAMDWADMVRLVHGWEAQEGVRLGSVATLDSTDPAAWLLGLNPVPGLSIVQDGLRLDFTQFQDRLREAFASVDLILVPGCRSVVGARDAYLQSMGSLLKARRRVELSGCWTGYVRPGLVAAAAPTSG